MRPPGPKVQAFGGCRGTSGDRVLDSIRRLTEPARGVGNAGVPSQHFVPHIFFGLDPMMVSTVVLCVTYGVIIWDKLNRAIVALLGASVMVLVGALDQNEALKGIDWNTIGLLTGMMILVSISRRSGMFEYLAIWSAQKAKASPPGILLLLQITTAVVSALLDNVTTVLLVVPVTLAITRELDVPPYPFLFAEVFASNIGGTATLIGDPPNIMIGSLVGLDFNAFIIHLAPVIVVIMAVQALMIHLLWGRALKSTPARRALVMGMSAKETILDWTLLKQALAVLAAVIAAFVLARPLHLEPATIALAGAAMLMFLDNWQHHNEKQSANVHRTFSDVEWITIFFFIGLFVVVRGVEVGGLLALLANALVAATGGDLATTGYAILWASAFLSAIVDNIPFVATMIPLIKSMAPAFGGADKIEPLWWCLSLGACLGGNGTLIGASANLTVAGIAERNGVPFRFVTYLVYGMPMMIVSIAIAHLYVWWRYF
jgi:Na+/H+ antiporter NhaD/arsenite permease-like protein